MGFETFTHINGSYIENISTGKVFKLYADSYDPSALEFYLYDNDIRAGALSE